MALGGTLPPGGAAGTACQGFDDVGGGSPHYVNDVCEVDRYLTNALCPYN